MKVDQKQFEIQILKGFTSLQELLNDVSQEIKLKGYGDGWYLRKLEMTDWSKYSIVVEKIIS